jgi:type II secretory pathway component PulJ
VKKTKKQNAKKGQALIEYVLLLVIMSAFSLSIYKVFNDIIRKGILKYNAVLELNLRTGGYTNPPPKSVWEN